ncbi:hypothetical protein JWG41_18280 [Leptospira sp. 201903075]|uniref:hypothetical protein n=1 Tax=Leptospira chreensis TaxID=2810035 RepID=UPI001965342E|nr:hypothetical protein [Leptospira chreensis]MBM9592397.1 hypothetical protein [Leptospira chreensis]
MKITRTYSRLPKEVGVLLGKEIQLARKEKAWSEQTLLPKRIRTKIKKVKDDF